MNIEHSVDVDDLIKRVAELEKQIAGLRYCGNCYNRYTVSSVCYGRYGDSCCGSWISDNMTKEEREE